MDSNFWYDLLEKIILLSVTAIMPVLVAFLFAAFKKKWAEFKSYANDYGWDVEEMAKIAVKAAEGLQLAGKIADKKEYAINLMQHQLDSKGIKINLAIIEAAIEAAVFEEFNKAKSKEVK
jgi:LL-H family phage holin